MASFLVDGQPADGVAPADRGLLYGDGVFRTLRLRAGRPLNWAIQYRLLREDCAALALPTPAESVLLGEIRQLGAGDAIARIAVTRGVGQRGYGYAEPVVPTRLVAAYPDVPVDNAAQREGVRVRRCSLILSEQRRLAGVKSLNRLENVLARAEWRDPEIREGLLLDRAGRVIEATASNLFAVFGRRLVTPDLSRCGVRGAQRERILGFAREAGLEVEVADLPFSNLMGADEAFLANSVIGIWPVAACEARQWRRGPVTHALQRLIEQHDAG